MRDKRYIAEHRGGPLNLERHRLLANWAADCAEHVLYLFKEKYPDDPRPFQAIETARSWAGGECSVGIARAASVASHAAAREAGDSAAGFVARAAGHAVATAHMADHAPGAAYYAIKAIKAAYGDQDGDTSARREHDWQLACLPEPVRELVESTFRTKFAKLLSF